MQEAQFARVFQDLRAFGGSRNFGRAVFHHFDSQQKAFAADIADDFVFFLQLIQARHNEIAHLERVRLKIFFFDDFEDGFAHRGDDRISTEGIEMNFANERLRNFRRGHHRARAGRRFQCLWPS